MGLTTDRLEMIIRPKYPDFITVFYTDDCGIDMTAIATDKTKQRILGVGNDYIQALDNATNVVLAENRILTSEPINKIFVLDERQVNILNAWKDKLRKQSFDNTIGDIKYTFQTVNEDNDLHSITVDNYEFDVLDLTEYK